MMKYCLYCRSLIINGTTISNNIEQIIPRAVNKHFSFEAEFKKDGTNAEEVGTFEAPYAF